MKNLPILIIATLLLLAFGMSYVEFQMNLEGEELSERTWGLWTFLNIILVGTWVLYDSKSSNFKKPFDFGLFLYLFLPFLLVYYLVRSRGHEGLVIYRSLGFQETGESYFEMNNEKHRNVLFKYST